jgi:hypothetical protein
MVDEYHGQGGSYVLDPKTGKRKLIEPTEPATQTLNIEELSNGSPDPQAPDSGKSRKPLRN